MKISNLLIVLSLTIISIECAKNYRFLSLESCTTDNEDIGKIITCEIDGIYFTINAHIKVPVTKAMVSL
jgi:hypothetical protein